VVTDRPWHDTTPHHDADHRAGILAEWGVVEEGSAPVPAYVVEGYRQQWQHEVRRADEALARVEAAREALDIIAAERDALRDELEAVRVAAGVQDRGAIVARIRSLRARSR
jgi:predicted  nucleic acid-binding Zn-ribbon protein